MRWLVVSPVSVTLSVRGVAELPAALDQSVFLQVGSPRRRRNRRSGSSEDDRVSSGGIALAALHEIPMLPDWRLTRRVIAPALVNSMLRSAPGLPARPALRLGACAACKAWRLLVDDLFLIQQGTGLAPGSGRGHSRLASSPGARHPQSGRACSATASKRARSMIRAGRLVFHHVAVFDSTLVTKPPTRRESEPLPTASNRPVNHPTVERCVCRLWPP